MKNHLLINVCQVCVTQTCKFINDIISCAAENCNNIVEENIFFIKILLNTNSLDCIIVLRYKFKYSNSKFNAFDDEMS